MSKQQMIKGAILKYIGRYFEGFIENQPYMTFLGYESCGWLDIWVAYRGEIKLLSLSDIELTG
ncbi:MAG: hypothetical protein V4592_25160 [Bacteroidota bacterium]